MSQIVRSKMVERLCKSSTLKREDVMRMSDDEVEYYHWFYVEDTIHDLM
ncbi:hypothetical protein [Pseudalkalibacillus caeni]|nr:hypothetical protein [Pseudalkalibacillus caeni]